MGPVEVALEHVAGIALEGLAVVVEDVAEHPGRRVVALGPREQLEAVGVGPGEHVALLHAAEAVDGGAVEVHALVERVLELGRADGDGLELAEHIGEPQPDQADAALLDGAEHVVLLTFHGAHVGTSPRAPRTGPFPVHGAFTNGQWVRNCALEAWVRLRRARRRAPAASRIVACRSRNARTTVSLRLASVPCRSDRECIGSNGGTRARKHSRGRSHAGQVGGARVHRLPVL